MAATEELGLDSTLFSLRSKSRSGCNTSSARTEMSLPLKVVELPFARATDDGFCDFPLRINDECLTTLGLSNR